MVCGCVDAPTELGMQGLGVVGHLDRFGGEGSNKTTLAASALSLFAICYGIVKRRGIAARSPPTNDSPRYVQRIRFIAENSPEHLEWSGKMQMIHQRNIPPPR